MQDTEQLKETFDAKWFSDTYREKLPAALRDTEDPEGLFAFYLAGSKQQKLSPNPDFDEDLYCTLYRDIAEAIDSGKIYNGYTHYLLYGSKEGRVANRKNLHSFAKGKDVIKQDSIMNILRMMFDPKWYQAKYLDHEAVIAKQEKLYELQPDELFAHYIINSRQHLFSPNAMFNEEYYLCVNEDIVKAIDDGRFLNGYEHFLVAGRHEGRGFAPDLERDLERKHPGITAPVSIQSFEHLAYRMRPLSFAVRSTKKKINILLPTIDPDIMFGGYISMHNLIRRIVEQGYDVRLIIFEDASKEDISLIKIRDRGLELAKILKHLEICNVTQRDEKLIISPNDRFIAYNAWGVHMAYDMARKTDFKRVIYFAQEYEAIFHDNSSIRAIVEDTFNYPNFYLINSQLLLKFFKNRRIGNLHTAVEGHDYLCFSHVISEVSPSLTEMESRNDKRFLFYARPEGHAKRNLFEIGILGLQKALKRLAFKEGEWSFHGIGTLGKKYDIGLNEEHRMKIVSKIANAKYSDMLRTFDLGMSLMFAPHPSVVPYEMAKSGMIVVTNTYENRDEADLKGISSNIVPATPSVNGIADAIEAAVPMVYNYEQRLKGADFSTPMSWNEAFHDEFMTKLSTVLG